MLHFPYVFKVFLLQIPQFFPARFARRKPSFSYGFPRFQSHCLVCGIGRRAHGVLLGRKSSLCSKSQHLLVNPLFRSDANMLIWYNTHTCANLSYRTRQGTIVLLPEFHISYISIWDVSFQIDISEISESFVMGVERRGRGTTFTSTPGFSNFRRVGITFPCLHPFLVSQVLLSSLLL